MKIYVASSWRNEYQPTVVQALRDKGHQVYDFKEPSTAFHWEDVDPEWLTWDLTQYAAALEHPLAQQGFDRDFTALALSDACVLVLPAGASAHLEAGVFIGSHRPLVIYNPSPEIRPELMYKMCTTMVSTIHQVLEAFH